MNTPDTPPARPHPDPATPESAPQASANLHQPAAVSQFPAGGIAGNSTGSIAGNSPSAEDRSPEPPARRVIYLHGFRSSSQSFKAKLLHARLVDFGMGERFVAPDLPPSPAAAMTAVVNDLRPGADDLLVGSSLGGCYATWLAERSGARAVLLNPAVHAARDLAGQVGEQIGYHDGLPFWFDHRYLDEVRELEAVTIGQPARYLLIAAKGDEVLDWREMVARFATSPQWILEGGDHGLSNFVDLVDEVLAFGGLPGKRIG